MGCGWPGRANVEFWPLPVTDRWRAALPPSYYEIRVIGVLPPEALLDFERLSASVEPVETVLHGPLRDQAALHGLLARLQAIGVQVIEVRRLHQPAPPAPDPPATPSPAPDTRPAMRTTPAGSPSDRDRTPLCLYEMAEAAMVMSARS